MNTATTPTMLPDIKVPAGWTLAGLAAGMALGMALHDSAAMPRVLEVAGPVGALWLRGLKMTIVPLVIGLLVTGLIRTVAAARAGVMARRTLGMFIGFLASGAVMAALVMPLVLRLFPIPAGAAQALREGTAAAAVPTAIPGLGAFLDSLVPSNVIQAAASDAMLPLIVFFSLFAVAVTRLAEPHRLVMADLFEALTGAMMVMIGWVLKLAPIGVLALGFSVAANSGSAAIGALAHYILSVASIGLVVMIGGYVLAVVGGRVPLPLFARAMLPAQAVAFSTQSSLASLPAMLAGCRRLGLRETSAEFVLPLAVALFRATGPAMNLAVAIYVTQLAGVEITPVTLIAGVAAATLTTLGAPSLPGTISFVTSIAPVALAMGAPIGPLAVLVAVEMLPDLMRTVGNVTMDVAVTATVDRRSHDAG